MRFPCAPVSAAMAGLQSHFEISSDVLDHDDRVVHDESRRNGQCHQREIVDAVSQQVHHAERSQQRERNRNAWNDRGPHVSQEDEYDQNHQTNGNQNRVLDIGDRCANGRGAVNDDGEIDRSEESTPSTAEAERRCRSTVSMIFAEGCLIDLDQNGRLAIGQPGVPAIFERIGRRSRCPTSRTAAPFCKRRSAADTLRP